MLTQFRNLRFYIIIAIDIIIFVMAFVGAYLLRFDFAPKPIYWAQIMSLLPVLIPGKVLIFYFFGLYQSLWRYTSLKDLLHLLLASLLSILLYFGITFFVHGLKSIPRSVFLLDGLLTIILSGGVRVAIRYFNVTSFRFKHLTSLFSRLQVDHHGRKSVLIIGAGNAGEKIFREIAENPRLKHHVVGFLDDDRGKWGRNLHGVKVYGGVDMLPKIFERAIIDEILIAIPTASGAEMRRIIQICKQSKVRYRTLPEIGAIIDGKVSIKDLRDVQYEDLLRRPIVKLDTSEISKYLKDKQVLVTGAGGSIGSELCRQIIRFNPKELIMVDASEEHLFAIEMELKHELNFSRYQCILGQVQDLSLMGRVFTEYRPQIVFHAAAYKHVPMLEKNPWQAIVNNVLSSQVVMNLSIKNGVERFVLVSTDKAVRPTNVMGASKRLAELIMQSLQGNGTRLMAVRFGNVVGSSGSVIPLFRRQLELGGPITVTHPNVTRYFMAISEAAQLILQAGGLGEGGETFILEMGTPIKIYKMAEDLARLSGKEPGRDVEIIFTGLREGEKLYEELLAQDEFIIKTKHERITVIRADGEKGGQNKLRTCQCLKDSLEDLFHYATNHDADAIKNKLIELIPEYVPARVRSVFDKHCSNLALEGPFNSIDCKMGIHVDDDPLRREISPSTLLSMKHDK